MASPEGHALTVVIPTYNERDNLPALFREFSKLRATWDTPFDLLIEDDNSPDRTSELATELGERWGVATRVVLRQPPRSLGGAILDGVRESTTDLVCVMDADLSHPPFLLPLMLNRLNGFDGVVASRYTPGGRVVHWPAHRRIISLSATSIAQRVIRTQCADPMSGYFLFRRAALQGVSITGLGHKPLFEILAQRELTIYEVPYVFRDRENGRSKLGGRGILDYLRLVMKLEFGPQSPTDGASYGKGAPSASRDP